MASVKKAHPNKKVIGFAAETENVLDNAKLKLSEKELDLIIANDVSNAEIGFDSDDNEVHLISEKNSRKINKSTKEKVSREIIKYISDNLKLLDGYWLEFWASFCLTSLKLSQVNIKRNLIYR